MLKVATHSQLKNEKLSYALHVLLFENNKKKVVSDKKMGRYQTVKIV